MTGMAAKGTNQVWAMDFVHDQLATAVIGPEIEVTGDDLRALVDPDRLRIAHFPADLFQRFNHILTPVVELGIHGWCVA